MKPVVFGLIGLVAISIAPLQARDPALWPFSAESPWNQSIGSSAQYSTIVSNGFSKDSGGVVNSKNWSHPIVIGTTSDPLRSVYKVGSATPVATLRVPESATPDVKSDGNLHFIDDAHTYVVETWECVKRPDGNWEGTVAIKNDLRGPGVFDKYGGARAYGGSAIGGIIRKGELANGIPHALAVGVDGPSFNRNAPGGKTFVWPASSADANSATIYGSTGNLYMGSLLAIPPEVDISKIGVGTSGPAFEMAKALQDYGCYIVDRAGGNLVFYAETGAQDEVPVDIQTKVALLVLHLKTVTNNSPTSVGGGGVHRRPLAPAFDGTAIFHYQPRLGKSQTSKPQNFNADGRQFPNHASSRINGFESFWSYKRTLPLQDLAE